MSYVKIKNTAAADDSLAKYAAAIREIDLIELGLNEAIDNLKTEAQLKSRDFLNVVEMEKSRLKVFAKANKSEFNGRQSLDLAHGRIGFRKSTSLALVDKGDTWDEVRQRLEADKRTDVIKVEKKVDKEMLEKWSDDRLAQYGLKTKESQTFFISIEEEEVAKQ
jgi:glycine cleavage system aminomethyltransferase T